MNTIARQHYSFPLSPSWCPTPACGLPTAVNVVLNELPKRIHGKRRDGQSRGAYEGPA